MNDLKFSLRQLAKSRGFTVVAVISLALGIGASTAVFSLYNAVLLRSLPVPNPQELRVVQWDGTDVRMSSFEGSAVYEGSHWKGADCVTHPTFLRLREASSRQTDLFGFCPVRNSVVGFRGQASVANGMMVSDNFFSGLQMRPYLGRCLGESEDYAGRMNVVVSYNWWQKHFGADHEALGQALLLDGTTYTIVGVLPRGFTGVQPGNPAEFYVPMSAGCPFLYAPINENWHWFVRLMARMKPGVTEAQFGATLDVPFASEAQQTMQGPRMSLQPGYRGTAYDRNTYGKTLRLLLGAMGLVLLVACSNLAGLSLARGATRQHELAVRAALGAGWWRLVRQSLTESLLIGIIGGCLGIVLAVWGRIILAQLLTGSVSGLRYNLELDLAVLGFGLAVTVVTSILSGLLPALRAGGADPLGGLKTRGSLGPRLRFGRILVASQICLSMLLLAGAGLYSRTLANLNRINAGFNVDQLMLVGLNIKPGVMQNLTLLPSMSACRKR
jgi:predicted permease